MSKCPTLCQYRPCAIEKISISQMIPLTPQHLLLSRKQPYFSHSQVFHFTLQDLKGSGCLGPTTAMDRNHLCTLSCILKGKGFDPRNWGAAGLNPSEIDVDAQRLAFEAYARAHIPLVLEEPPVMLLCHPKDPTKASHKSYWATVKDKEDVDAPSKPCKLKALDVVDSDCRGASSMAGTLVLQMLWQVVATQCL